MALAQTIIDVRHFGAKGDGIADDTSEIQSAIDAAFAVGGGTVMFPAGTYNVSSTIELKTGCNMVGAGRASTIRDSVGNRAIVDIHDATDILVADLAFTGSGVLGTAGRAAVRLLLGTSTGGTRVTLQRLYVHNVGTTGIVVGGSSTDVLVDDCVVSSTAEHGIYISSASSVTVQNCRVHDAGQAGGVSTVVGIKIADSSDVKVHGCTVTNALTDGIIIDVAASGVEIYDNWVASANRDGIRINSAGDGCTVRGNTILSPAQRGIRVVTASKSAIEDNVIRYAATPPAAGTPPAIQVDATGTDTEVRRNRVYGGSTTSYAIDVLGPRTAVAANRVTDATLGIRFQASATGSVESHNVVSASTTAFSDAVDARMNPAAVAAGTLPVAGSAYRGQVRSKSASGAEDVPVMCVLSADGSTYKWINLTTGATVT